MIPKIFYTISALNEMFYYSIFMKNTRIVLVSSGLSNRNLSVHSVKDNTVHMKIDTRKSCIKISACHIFLECSTEHDV